MPTETIPVELIADPIINNVVVPSGMAISQYFDWSPVLGLPIWVPITFIFILLNICVIAYWFLRIGRLSSVKGWAESLKKMSQDDVQVWVISRVKKLTIECMTIRDNVLSSHDPLNLSMFHVNSENGVVRVGGVGAVVVSEDFDQNRDFITEIALTHNCDIFNNNQEILKREAQDKYFNDVEDAKRTGQELQVIPPQIIQPITDCDAYEKYGRKVLEHLNPDGLSYPSYTMFNPSLFRKYFPRGCSSMWFGGELIHDARKLNLRRKEKSFLEVHAFLMMCGGISIISIMAAWLFPIGGA